MTDQIQTPEGALKYQTREDWLNAFIDAARSQFVAVNAPLPINLRVAIGFTSKGGKGKSIGECWSSDASEDGHYEIFIKPTLENPARICGVLTHELIHAAVGIPAGHGPAFKRVMIALGLTGKATATVESEAWYRWALPLIAELGPFPYGALSGSLVSGRKKQKAYLLKAECDTCGWTARVTAKHVRPVMNCPDPDCHGALVCDTPDDDGADD